MVYPIEVRPARPDEHAAVGELLARVYEDEGWGVGRATSTVLRDVTGRAEHARGAGRGRRRTACSARSRWRPAAGRPPSRPGRARRSSGCSSPTRRPAGAAPATALVAACLDAARRDGCTLRAAVDAARDGGRAPGVRAVGFARTPERDWQPEPGLTLLTYALDLPAYCDACGEPGSHPALRGPPRPGAAALLPPLPAADGGAGDADRLDGPLRGARHDEQRGRAGLDRRTRPAAAPARSRPPRCAAGRAAPAARRTAPWSRGRRR